MKLITQSIIQLVLGVVGMVIDYRLEGHVLAGGLLGTALGLVVVLGNYFF